MLKTIAALILFIIACVCQAANVVTIDKDCITLQDIFPSLSGNDEIFCGLDYGQEKTINRQMSAYIINKYGVKGAQPGEVTFRRSGTLLTESRLKEDIKNQLSMMYPGMDIDIDNVRMGRDYFIPDNGQYTLDIPQNRFGNLMINVDNGVRKYTYSITLTAYKNVYVTNGPIRKGDPLDGRVTVMRTDITHMRGDAVTDIKGYIARMNIGAGRPVINGMVEKRPDALKNTQVNIVYNNGVLEINATGKLLDDAFIGESARVENSDSGSVLRGIYQGNRTVLITPAQ